MENTVTNKEVDDMLKEISTTLEQHWDRNYLDCARECGLVAPNDVVLNFARLLVDSTVQRCASVVEGVDVEVERQFWAGEIDERPELDGRYYAQVLRNHKF